MKGKQIINFLAFWSIAVIAVVLVLGTLLSKILNPNIINLLQLIALIVAEGITAVYAYSYAKDKQKLAWTIVYFVLVALIVVFTSVRLVGIIRAF